MKKYFLLVFFLFVSGYSALPLGTRFKLIPNDEIFVIDTRDNGYYDVYEPERNAYVKSFALPGGLIDIAAGDLDRSGFDEIIGLRSTSPNRIYIRYRNSSGDWIGVDYDCGKRNLKYITAGDYLHDSISPGYEIIAASSDSIFWWSWNLSSGITLRKSMAKGPIYDITAGDIDGDREDEVVIITSGDKRGFDVISEKAGSFHFELPVKDETFGTWLALSGGNVQGDLRAEIVVLEDKYWPWEKCRLRFYQYNPADSTFQEIKVMGTDYGYLKDVACGNPDRDRYWEVFALDGEGSEYHKPVHIYSYQGKEGSFNLNGSKNPVRIAVGEYDGDNAQIELLGGPYLCSSELWPHFVLALPPYQDGIVVGECKIKYGEGFQQNQNREATVSVKANTNIGYKGQYPGGLFEYEIMASLEAGIKKYLGDARSYEWGHWFEFSSKTGKFVVIATRTYYDSYLYKILDPNDLLGSDNHNDTINMNVPKASSSALPLYYEDYRAYADTIPRLPKILLPPLERPGRVVSYPRGFVYPNGYPVPTSELMLINHPIYHITREGTQGGWYIRLSEQQVNQSVLSSSANLVFGVKVLNMAFRIAGSVGAEYTHTIKAGKLLEIKADMGYIPDSLPYWHWYYEYVPYIYRAPKDSGGYYVLNFFVQNLGPGYQNQIGESKNNPLLVTEFLSPHPNPFTKTTSIQFTLAQPGNVSLKIYNPAGQLVATLLNHFEKPGRYNLLWKGIDDNGKRVASGIYYCELIAGSYHSIKKVILAR